MSNTEIAQKVQDLKELKSMAEELAAEIDALEDAVKAEMSARSVDELNTGLFTVRYKTVAGSRFDTKAFKADQPELAARYTKSTQSSRFTIC